MISIVAQTLLLVAAAAEGTLEERTHVAAAAEGTLEEITHAAGAATLCDASVTQHTGYYKLTDGALPKNYFYWAFESRSSPSDPVVLWMTGGPGCSSEVALFGENGPCQVTSDGTATTNNPYSWNSNATLIYIDQPSGTGFSFGSGMDHDEAGVAADMYNFLQQFFIAHPEYSARDFFVFGESYAGHYVPAVTHLIWKNNKSLQPGAIKINLKVRVARATFRAAPRLRALTRSLARPRAHTLWTHSGHTLDGRGRRLGTDSLTRRCSTSTTRTWRTQRTTTRQQ
jgi:cathepsin A (carboxypeptidase C)